MDILWGDFCAAFGCAPGSGVYYMKTGIKRKGKRILVWILAVAWCLGLVGNAYGESDIAIEAFDGKRIFDMAGLLDKEYVQEAREVINQYQDTYHLDIVVVTTDDAKGKTATAYADDFYEECGFGQGKGKNGILFLIDMDNRELVFSTDGAAIRIFTDQRIESMLDGVYEGASREDYRASVESFLRDVEQYCKAGIPGNQYNYNTETGEISVYRSIRWYEALLAIGVSAFVAGTACLTVKRQYGMEDDERQVQNLAMAYRGSARFIYDDESDRLVNKFVTSRVIPRNTGGGGSGGHSSSGRSSTHTSSSGRSHGGGSRKF